jgi:hypothetical protein
VEPASKIFRGDDIDWDENFLRERGLASLSREFHNRSLSMKPGDLVAVTADNADQGIGILLQKISGEPIWRVLLYGQVTQWCDWELSPL